MTRFSWVVLTGLTTEDVQPDDLLASSYGRAIERALVERGCTPPWSEAFDRTIFVAPEVVIGPYTGQAYAIDRVAMKHWARSLAAHELAHTFGATDLYLEEGAGFQYSNALMGHFGDVLDGHSDVVLWGEVGLGDVDGDRELDALAFSRAPERILLDLFTVKAFPASKNLSFTARFRGEEDGRALRILPRAFTIEAPEHGLHLELKIDTHRLVATEPDELDTYFTYAAAPRDLSEAAFDAMVTAGSVRFRVTTEHAYTTDTFERRPVALDHVEDVPLDIKRPDTPGDLRRP